MWRSRNRETVGLLLALVLMIIVCSGCFDSSGADQNSSCPTQEEVDQAIANAADLREEADGLDGGQGRQAREDASDAEEEAASLQSAFDSDECVAERNPTTTTTEEPSTTTTTQVEEDEDPASGLPVVEGGDPANPTPGSETNQDPRTPVVRDGHIVTGWRGLDHLLGNDHAYVNCANTTVPGLSWERDVPWYKSVERHGQDTRFILAVNASANLSDEAIRQIASDDVGEDVSHLQILRVDQIVNTRGFTQGHCEQFIDRRSMVRVSLGRVMFNPDGSIKGLADDGGIFVDCHNPWRLTIPAPPATPPGTTTPNNPPPPSGGGGKDHRLSPVTSNPNDPCEACRPNTPEPPRTTPPPVTQPTVPTPTTVAPPAPPPTTTAPPPPPGPGCQDPDGIGICAV